MASLVRIQGHVQLVQLFQRVGQPQRVSVSEKLALLGSEGGTSGKLLLHQLLLAYRVVCNE
jgi:hypothetical protein